MWNSKLAGKANTAVLAACNETEDILPAVRIPGTTLSATRSSCQALGIGMSDGQTFRQSQNSSTIDLKDFLLDFLPVEQDPGPP